MTELWFRLLPILLADVVNPVLFAFMVYASGLRRGVLLSSMALLGHTASYLGFGIAIALAYDALSDFIYNPGTVSYAVGGVLGALLLGLAITTRSDQGTAPEPDAETFTPMAAFSTGALINVIGIPFALPYFAAIDQILDAGLGVGASAAQILAYNIGYLLPFLLVPVVTLAMGADGRTLLGRINAWLTRVSAILMPVLFGLIGLVLLVDAGLWFATGEGLY